MTAFELVLREQVRLRSKLVLASGAMALAAGAAILALGVLILGGSRWIALPPAAPFLFWIVVGVAFVLAAAHVVRLRRTIASTERVAAEIETEGGMRDGSLRGVLEVANSGELGRQASRSMASDLGARVGGLVPRLQGSARLRAVCCGGVALLGAVALIGARGATPDGWQALAHPLSAWKGTLVAPLRIDAPSAVMRGEKVEILINAESRHNVTLFHRATGSAWRESDHSVGGDEMARVVLGPVDADIKLVAGDGRSLSDTVLLRMTDRPFVGDVSIRANYPAYLGRPAEGLAIGEPATLPRGTVLEMSGHASVALSRVSLVREESDTTEMIVEGHRFRGKLAPLMSGQWKWLATGQMVSIADGPPPLDITVVSDSAPHARIMWPTSDTLLAPNQKLDLELAAVDDHGLGSVVLKTWTRRADGRSTPAASEELAGNAGAAWSGMSRIDLARWGLSAGDELHMVLQATDASPWLQAGNSRELIVRVPTSAEQRALARDAADSAVADALAAAGAQRELERQTGDASRSRDRAASGTQSGSSGTNDAQSMSYEAAERARSLAGAQKDIEQQIDNLQRAARQMEEQLRQAGALDSGLASRITEARQLLNQAMTQELRDHVKKLEEAAQQLSGEQARQSLAELAAAQKRLREQLEKSAAMLQRAAFEGSMQTLSDDAREISGREQKLADSLRANPPSGDRSSAQRDTRELQAQSEALKREMDQLAKRLAEATANPGARGTEEAAKQAQAALDALRKLNESLAQPPGATGDQQQQQAQNAQAAADAMRKSAEQLSAARDNQIGEWKSEVGRALDQAIQEMQQLARQQQRVEQQLQQGSSPDSLRGEQSAIQQGVQQVNEKLQQAGRTSSLFSPQSQKATGDAQNKVQQATQQLAGSQATGQMSSAMKESASAMQQASAALARDRERVNTAKSASGFSDMIEQMRQLAQQQGGLNGMSQGLAQGSSSMPADQRAREAAELARQQRELARRMEELADASGRSEALANEARRIAAAMDAGIIDQATLQRQQQLFRRLLDAGRTLEQGEPDSTGKRESRSATGDARFDPGNVSGRGAAAQKYTVPGWDELRGLTPDERRAVLEYFKRINGGG